MILSKARKSGYHAGMKTIRRNISLATELQNGDRLTRAEFHRLYEASAEHVRAELIEGIVHMPSPVGLHHSNYHFEIGGLHLQYKRATPGVEGGIEPTLILDDENEPQPDILLRIVSECRGQTHVAGKYLSGAPEFISEISHSSVSIDLGKKKNAFFKAGVQEYLVVCLKEQELHWFHFPSRRKLRPDKNGVWKSKVFPGFWLDEPALHLQDSNQLFATMQKGIESPEHAEFVAKLERLRNEGRR
jgi:Uma2 family endonuclease